MRRKNITKGLIFGVLAVSVIALTGCGEKIDQLKDAKDNVTSKIEDGKELVDAGKELTKDGNGFMGGLKEAMQGGVAMKCVNTDADGEWVTYTNGKKFRSEGIEGGKTQIVLVTDGASYIWEKGAKTGQKMDMKCIKDFQKDIGMPDFTEEDEMDFDYTPEELEAEEASGKLKCTPATDADFSVPTDVTFVDQCEVMKKEMAGFKEQMQNMGQ